jgi:hypothetical protein
VLGAWALEPEYFRLILGTAIFPFWLEPQPIRTKLARKGSVSPRIDVSQVSVSSNSKFFSQMQSR